MDIRVKTGEIQNENGELIVVNLFEGVTAPGGATGAVDKALGGQISRLIADGDFKGKVRETALLYSNGGVPARRVLVVGLGKADRFNLEAIRVAAATAARRVCDLRVKSFSTIVHGAGRGSIDLVDAAQAVVEGTELALYEFRELKTRPDDDPKKVENMTFVVFDPDKQAEVEAGVALGRTVAAGVSLARDLVNRPANYATPTVLAQQAQSLAQEVGLTCHILDEDAMADLGMGSLLGVAQGSDEPAKFIVLEHNTGRDDLDTLVLVGKGVTFDSGGISIKGREGMEDMKGDMAGGAAVLGAMQAVATLGLPLHVVGMVPATENLPSGKAYKPGDVVRAMNGTTIEVISTDAEGRMLLADALCYAARYRPRAVVDIATLTGAIMVALGAHAAGLFDNNDDLAARLEAAGRITHERLWRMPLFEEYGEQLKSLVADFKHTGGRAAGAITAACFLSKFAADFPWAHLDIAGRAWTDDDKPYTPRWATGYGVRLLIQFLRDWAASPPA
ncbi:MAG: leucyl aminopeptidase [Chloroflexota bacterium]